ncbi:PcfJ domain-containing protein [Singulisphaera sp. PoT]|uniref:PcfJ domain-containing protein n=1 Tax=Singulisphaera sp. PoT TaxID=3411797 RepID=UPI003BF46145
MSTTQARKNAANAAIDRAIQAAVRSVDGRYFRTKQAFDRLLWIVRSRSDLLRLARSGGRVEVDGACAVVRGLFALARFHANWLRPPEDWQPLGSGRLPQASSLAGHLLSNYEIPSFMTSVWLKEPGPEASRQQGWYLHLGLGQNIRKADLPLQYSKRMAHEFLQAPAHFSVEHALRWGQVRGLGGTKKLAQAIIASRLGRSFESEEFWKTVVHFFVNHPDVGLDNIEPIVEYLHDQRFSPQEVYYERCEYVTLDPPQPNLTMKGRTAKSLLRQVADWRDATKRARRRVAKSLRWKPTGIADFELIEPSTTPDVLHRRWTIREITTSDDLIREGQAMSHCVGGYVRACARGESSIWSLRFDNGERHFRVLTVEVDPSTKTICQAKRRLNHSPSLKLVAILRQWAEQAGLSLDL